MKIARNVFKLYKKFTDLPFYSNEDDPLVLENFMTKYKEYLI